MKEAFTVTGGIGEASADSPTQLCNLRESLADYDARLKYGVHVEQAKNFIGCECHLVIIGKIKPNECPMFLEGLTPEKPVGACMVSSEGTCRVWAKNVAVEA